MPLNVLGKALFPQLGRLERSRKLKTILGVVFAALLVGGSLGALFYLQNTVQR